MRAVQHDIAADLCATELELANALPAGCVHPVDTELWVRSKWVDTVLWHRRQWVEGGAAVPQQGIRARPPVYALGCGALLSVDAAIASFDPGNGRRCRWCAQPEPASPTRARGATRARRGPKTQQPQAG